VKKRGKTLKNGKANGVRRATKLNGVALRRRSSGTNGHAPAPVLLPAALTDRQLIDRAVGGDTAAWDALYLQCHRPLMTAIRSMLRGRAVDANLVDELAARVWYAVVREQGELLRRFDPARGCRLTTYLATIAKDEAGRLFRSERRRRRREAASCDSPSAADETASKAGHTSVTMAEFEATLTPSEKKFYNEIVAEPLLLSQSCPSVEPNGAAAAARSQANLWQLSHRVRRKLERFLDG
jgi:DNA-directed RNA polymerase specialized sigma24 family protein